MDKILDTNFLPTSFFGCQVQFELVFLFAGVVGLIMSILFIINVSLFDRADDGDYLMAIGYVLAIALPVSLAVIGLSYWLPSPSNLYFNKIVSQKFGKEVEETRADLAWKMTHEVEDRISEVETIYEV